VLDQDILQRFEAGLDPQSPEASAIPCKVLGYGEISCVLEIDGNRDIAAKRMPLFKTLGAAQTYAEAYGRYVRRLREAGLFVPEDDTVLVTGRNGLVVLYILQQQLPPARFCHKLIHAQGDTDPAALVNRIIGELEKVWSYNTDQKPAVELAIDGQLSNWVLLEDDRLAYIDTSTPLMLEEGVETLDPELLLQSAPSFLRWLIRWLFLEDVMTRYYDRRLVYTDLVANLFKEQCPDLVPGWIKAINEATQGFMEPLDKKSIEAYYREDKLIWRLFLGLRKLDRSIKTKVLGQTYEFVLPGPIKR